MSHAPLTRPTPRAARGGAVWRNGAAAPEFGARSKSAQCMRWEERACVLALVQGRTPGVAPGRAPALRGDSGRGPELTARSTGVPGRLVLQPHGRRPPRAPSATGPSQAPQLRPCAPRPASTSRVFLSRSAERNRRDIASIFFWFGYPPWRTPPLAPRRLRFGSVAGDSERRRL